MVESLEVLSQTAVKHVSTLRCEAEHFRALDVNKKSFRTHLAVLLRTWAAYVDENVSETESANSAVY